MRTLILKLNATGDVVRTTPLLRVLNGVVTWITASRNVPLLEGISPNLVVVPWERREEAMGGDYELVINLEDEREVAEMAARVSAERRFGAVLDRAGALAYTEDANGWFDMSLISRFGRARADALKLRNRRTYQELLFEGLGFSFNDQRYLLPPPGPSDLRGDVAIASASGPVWPMKTWAYFGELGSELRRRGLLVNVLPTRPTLLEHLGDIANHRCVVGGDSLPMHLALGLGVPTIAIFNCTSPWEIRDYGLLTKLISPRIEEYFYRRDFDVEATRAIPLAACVEAIGRTLGGSP
jgi:heptosyltransferase-2